MTVANGPSSTPKASMRLGLLPPLNSGLSDLAQAGQETRLLNSYFPSYAAAFEHVYYFSYHRENLAGYTDDSTLLQKMTLLPGDGGNQYAFKLPFRWSAEMQSCHVLRTFQITGVIPPLIAKMRWRIPFAATYGYRYADFARTEGKTRRAFFLEMLEQIGLRRADAVIVTTPALAEKARQVRGTATGVHLIPNGVDTTLFSPAPRLPERRRVIFTGRLEPQKNLSMLIESLARIQPAPQLTIIGDGSQRESLKQLATQLGVDVEFAGVIPNEELGKWLISADIFALPSLIEGHPKALLEAMSCGLACVGLDVPGVRDVLINEQTGLVSAANVESLTMALARLLDDSELANRLGQAAHEWTIANYDLNRLLQQEIEMLQTLATTKRR